MMNQKGYYFLNIAFAVLTIGFFTSELSYADICSNIDEQEPILIRTKRVSEGKISFEKCFRNSKPGDGVTSDKFSVDDKKADVTTCKQLGTYETRSFKKLAAFVKAQQMNDLMENDVPVVTTLAEVGAGAGLGKAAGHYAAHKFVSAVGEHAVEEGVEIAGAGVSKVVTRGAIKGGEKFLEHGVEEGVAKAAEHGVGATIESAGEGDTNGGEGDAGELAKPSGEKGNSIGENEVVEKKSPEAIEEALEKIYRSEEFIKTYDEITGDTTHQVLQKVQSKNVRIPFTQRHLEVRDIPFVSLIGGAINQLHATDKTDIINAIEGEVTMYSNSSNIGASEEKGCSTILPKGIKINRDFGSKLELVLDLIEASGGGHSGHGHKSAKADRAPASKSTTTEENLGQSRAEEHPSAPQESSAPAPMSSEPMSANEMGSGL